MSEPSIALVYCYFGKLPWYFQWFTNSCGYNSTVDFYIYTDQPSPAMLPGNVKVKPVSIESFRALAEKKIGFSINLDYSYKLCDLKPAYGVIFEEDLESYDYWGIGDVDIIFGNIRTFLSNLNEVDVFCVRAEYVTGYFSLFRNTPFVKNLFRHSRDYQRVFQSHEHFCFDECNFQFALLSLGVSIFDTPAEIESMTHVVFRHYNAGNLRIHFDVHAVEGNPGDLQFSEGTLAYQNRFEVFLYHLISFKKHPLLIKPNWKTIPREYSIHKHFFLMEVWWKSFALIFSNVKVFCIWVKNHLDFFAASISMIVPRKQEYDVLNAVYHAGHLRAEVLEISRGILIQLRYDAINNSGLLARQNSRDVGIKEVKLRKYGHSKFISIKARMVAVFGFDQDRKCRRLTLTKLNQEVVNFYSAKD